VAVSAAGDLALSTGPWQFIPPETTVQAPGRTGWFLSVWRRQKDGAWKVAVDAGIPVPMPFAIPKTVENGFAASPAKVPHAKDAATARSEIAAAERMLTAAAANGIGSSVSTHADPLLRVYRKQKPVADGLDAARQALVEDRRQMACKPDKVVASASGDLGYSYGTCSGLGADASTTCGFLHVWRKQPDGAWKILVDVTP
jgi:ketosteroid isomerase-like protein